MAKSLHSADAIVIGGGLHGCSSALYLAQAGLSVIVLEKDTVGRHASTANAGGVRRLGRALPEIPLAQAALDCWQHISDLVDDDCGFSSSCQVKVAETDAELAALQKRHATLVELGYSHEELIDSQQLRELLPTIAPHCVGGMVVYGDGHANPFQTQHAFKRKAAAHGVRFIENSPVIGINKHGETWRIKSPLGDLEAPVLVNCAGAWGGQIAAMLGEFAPVEAMAFMLMITARVKPFIEPVVGSQGRTLSFKQFNNGTVMIGGGYQGRIEPNSIRTHLNFRGLAESAATATALFPNLSGVPVVRCWAGIEGESPDHIPVIGASAESGAYHAFGFSGHGFALSPIVGKVIAELVTQGESQLPIEAFSIERFADS
jgi:sarcosine oxidase subunit beta